LLLLALTTGGLFYWWQHSRVYVSTDNVYVVGNITPIASDVAGQVVALFIDDNMIVQPGDPIAQIDPVPFQMKVDQALADFKQAAYDADAADVTVHYTTDDRKSLLEGAQAKQAEAEQAVQAAEVALRTQARLEELARGCLRHVHGRLHDAGPRRCYGAAEGPGLTSGAARRLASNAGVHLDGFGDSACQVAPAHVRPPG
jgi:membrane fusion protein (multidrug efflux system)